MKKKAGIIALMAAIFLLSGVTAAYLSYENDVDNSFIVGTNTIEISEDYEPPGELTVGDNIFKKRVAVENTGNIPCFVRVFADFSDPAIRDISYISPDGVEWYAADEYKYHLPQGWEYVEEDDELMGSYYYYTHILAPGEKTPLLFDSIKTVIEDAGQIKDYEIIVYAESVQTLDKDGQEFAGSRAWEDAWREFLNRR